MQIRNSIFRLPKYPSASSFIILLSKRHILYLPSYFNAYIQKNVTVFNFHYQNIYLAFWTRNNSIFISITQAEISVKKKGNAYLINANTYATFWSRVLRQEFPLQKKAHLYLFMEYIRQEKQYTLRNSR